MRSLWTGTIGFGLVNIPIRLYSGTIEQAIDFDMLHRTDLSPIRYAKVCREEGEEVTQDEIVKGFEYEKGKYVVLTDEDFERANVKKTKMIEVLYFAEESEVDANYYDRPYFLEPDKSGERAYALLREALRESGKAGLTRFVSRNREHMALIRVQGDMLILNQMRFSHEIRPATELKFPSADMVKAKELKMALSLIEQLTETFEPEQLRNTYTEELEQMIEEKVQDKKPTKRSEAPAPSKVRDLMSLLQASVEVKRGEKMTKNTKSNKNNTPAKMSEPAASSKKRGSSKRRAS